MLWFLRMCAQAEEAGGVSFPTSSSFLSVTQSSNTAEW